MSKRVAGGLLSFLLAFSLLLPLAGAEGDARQGAEEGKGAVSKLNPAAPEVLDAVKAKELRLQSKKGPAGAKSAKTPLLGAGLQLERQDAAPDSAAVEPQSFVPLSDGTERISVIVELREAPVKVFEAAGSKLRSSKSLSTHKQTVNLEQQTFKKQAISKLNAKFKRSYSGIFNGFSLTIAANQVENLLKLPGVKAVYPNNEVYATAEEEAPSAPLGSVPFIGSEVFWEQGIKGRGIKVGVIDTGVAKDHPDLAAAVPDGDWGYDFVNEDNEPYETTKEDYEKARENDPALPEVNEDGKPFWTSHGTHVSGIVAGRGTGADSQAGIEGVAPEAEIHAYKVLGPYGSGTTENVIAGIERAVADGMDVINLSLGSDSNNERSADSVAVNNAMKAGVIAVVSSGNSGPEEATVGDPGSAELAITVGASKPPLDTPVMEIAGLEGDPFYMDTFDKSAGLENLTESYPLGDAGLGRPGDFEGRDWSGKVAFIKRGEIPFAEKALNAQASGALAAIIYNNLPEALESGTLGDADVTIPVYALSGADGERIIAALDRQELAAKFGSTVEQDIMAAFSSRGPSKPSYDIKPDISAPGVAIRSSVPDYEGWYEAQNGTSMAAPHIAGAAALLKQHYPELGPYEIKALLMNNALKLSDRSGSRYSHMDQGAGRVSLDQVAEAKAVALAGDTTDSVDGNEPTPYYTGSLSFGYVGYGSAVQREVIVKDIAGEASDYSIESVWYGGGSPVTLTLSETRAEVAAGGETSFTVAVEAPEEAASQRYEGELILTESSSGHVIHIPVSVYVGEAPQADAVTDLALTPNPFSPNGDGRFDTADITFTVNEYTEYFSLDVFALDGSWLGSLIEVEDGVSPDSYALRGWDGVDLPDGGYLLEPWVGTSLADAVPLENQFEVFIVDRKAPVSQLSDPAIKVDAASLRGTISGQVTEDLLIDLLVSEAGAAVSDVIGVAALFDGNGDGEREQMDGTIDDTGHFTIEVPIAPGDNTYEIYVYDLAGNGLVTPAHVVNYTLSGYVTPFVEPSRVQRNDPFKLDVLFSVTEAVYAAKFDLLYSSELEQVSVAPSPELSARQAAQNPDRPLTVSKAVYELDDGQTRFEFMESLHDAQGYAGDGSLATFTFQGAPAGQYTFQVANLALYDQNGNEIPAGLVSDTQVTVEERAELHVTPQSLSLEEGKNGRLTVAYKDTAGTVTDVTYAVYYGPEEPQIITVSKGTVTAHKPGKTKIKVTYEGLTATVGVTVTEASSGTGGGGGKNGDGKNSDGKNSGRIIMQNQQEQQKQSPPSQAVKEAIKANEPTVITLPNGFTLTIPAGAIPSPEAAFVQVAPASESDATTLIEGLKLGAELKPFGVYYDLALLDKDGKPIENVVFRKPAEASIPLSVLNAGGVNGEKLGLFKLGGQGVLEQHAGRLVNDRVVAHLNGFGRYMFMAREISFADVTEAGYPWAVNEIEVLAAQNIVTGRSANAFAPGSKVTRAEFVSLLVRALELEADEGAAGKANFSDVPADSWFADTLGIAAAKGLITGYENGAFGPNRQITRAEMAVILSKALAHLDLGTAGTAAAPSGFTDQAQIPGWAKESVGLAAKLGVMKGKSAGKFDAQQGATRAEAAVVIYRIFTQYRK
ncbi:MAG: S8 family serine peptidase [Paenibacillus macerans]|uniref:S8 family serine peptidase n=1 Tax=Paenibacillus macerans TaxID=44252 RepID=UPI002909569E|nr:S8 family serine peptidase [Paenibacillus macerans]MDU7473653.1 S8 family serine peptidase [Paenibacillus macerans]